MENQHGHDVTLTDWWGHFTDQNRNNAVREFLKGDYDYLLFMDTDNPPSVNPLKLIDLDLDVLGLPTPIILGHLLRKYERRSPIVWNAYSYNAEKKVYEHVTQDSQKSTR